MFTMRPRRPDLTHVLPGLTVGAYPAPEDVPWLVETHGVRAVVSLQDDADLAAKRLTLGDLERAYAASDIAFARLPVTDGDEARMEQVLPEAVARIAAFVGDGRPTYLHCNAGMNRAPTVAIGYAHVHGGYGLVEATRLVKAVRPCVPFQGVLARVYGRAPLRPRTP